MKKGVVTLNAITFNRRKKSKNIKIFYKRTKSFPTSGRCPYFAFWEACKKYCAKNRQKISKNYFSHAFQNAKYGHLPLVEKLFVSTIYLQ